MKIHSDLRSDAIKKVTAFLNYLTDNCNYDENELKSQLWDAASIISDLEFQAYPRSKKAKEQSLQICLSTKHKNLNPFKVTLHETRT